MIKVSPRSRKVSFELELPEANNVVLVGEFNNWSSSANPMKKSRGGVWKAEMPLAAGHYQFRYLVDGNEWLNDGGSDTILNEFGSYNSVAEVEYPAEKKKSPAKKKAAAKSTTRKSSKKA
ncbi:MAG TPA: isoamylase early set domain-containing protein [Calditrichia bacterium]|nr:isoamylase early set domain-containing protein [Calditrichota bacterium]HQU74134.1 isoamylase early set domain-containing protein [Calditrichia bacterium]HQV31031.1 isoamylase early set domain-containing protein [Calditrichia bacterium]